MGVTGKMAPQGQEPSTAREGFTKTSATTFKDIIKRVNAHVPTVLLERFQEAPPHDTGIELSRLFASDEPNDKETFLVLLKTDHFLETLLNQGICDAKTATQWIDERAKDRGDILAAKGAFMSLKEAGAESKKLFSWINNLHPLECYDIAASGKSFDVMKGEIMEALVDIGFGWTDVEDWKCTAIGSGYISRHRRTALDNS